MSTRLASRTTLDLVTETRDDGYILGIRCRPCFQAVGTVTASWPLSGAMTIAATPAAVATARMHARMIVAEWAMVGVAEDVTLVVSELVTNAVIASAQADWPPGYTGLSGGLPTVHVRLRSDRTRIVIEVWDQSPRAPELRPPEPDAENGRGLLLVEALSERWGWDHVPGWSGKVAWAEICAR
jgi:anti-sigma regulatory factor (Ser/Thr protein kinase)